MKLSYKVGRWIRILGAILIVVGIALVVQALNAGVEPSLVAYLSLAAGVVGIILARRRREPDAEESA